MDKNIQDKIEEVQSKINEMQDKLEELKRVAAEKDNPYFGRVNEGVHYYTIDPRGYAIRQVETGDTIDHARYAVANYSKNKKLLKKRAAEETLSRLIWREAEIVNTKCEPVYDLRFTIYYNPKRRKFNTFATTDTPVPGTATFISVRDANTCIEKVVIPFVKSHPELGWELADEEEA